jgi:hypothetical protein
MKMRLKPVILAVWIAQSLAARASFVMDDFTEGAFELSLDGLTGIALTVDSPLGMRRYARIPVRLVAPGSVITSTLSTSSGSLSFLAEGKSELESLPLNLALSYLDGGPFNLEGYGAFEFDFAEVEGSGFLIVELGRQSFYGPETLRVPIGGAGPIQVPFEMLNFGAGASVGSFTSTHFTFEAGTERFAFVLSEIRVIPEPSSGLFLLLGGALLMLRRRRACPA